MQQIGDATSLMTPEPRKERGIEKNKSRMEEEVEKEKYWGNKDLCFGYTGDERVFYSYISKAQSEQH